MTYASGAYAESRTDADGAAMTALSGVGAAGEDVGSRFAYVLGVGPSFLDFQSSGAFRGLPGAPEKVTSGTWSISPSFVSNGRWATVVANPVLQFGHTNDQDGGASLHRTFGAEVFVHAGVNLFGALGLGTAKRGELGLSLGAGLLPRVGPKYELTVADGSTASVGGAAVPLGPSVAFNTLNESMTLSISAMYSPEIMMFAQTNAVDATGSLATYKPANLDSKSLGTSYEVSAQGMKQRRTFFGSVMLSTGTPKNAREPYVTFGLRADYRRVDWKFSDERPGWNDGFSDEELRVLVGIGIGIPEGYDARK